MADKDVGLVFTLRTKRLDKQKKIADRTSDEEEDCGFIFKRSSKHRKVSGDSTLNKQYLSSSAAETYSSLQNLNDLPKQTKSNAIIKKRGQASNNTLASSMPQPEEPPLKSHLPVNSLRSFLQRHSAGTTDILVPIPISETPMIRKNQDIRAGNVGRRRSSFSMRGKRASSIGNGFISQPHPNILPTDFYRHISPDIPDPLRMKQLLVWCGRKTVDAQDCKSVAGIVGKQVKDIGRILDLAKQIQEDVLNSLINNQISTSWYHRKMEDEGTEERFNGVKRPHPQNIENENKLKEYKALLNRLEAEDQKWECILRNVNNLHAEVLDDYRLQQMTDTEANAKALNYANIHEVEEELMATSAFMPEELKFLDQYCSDRTDEKDLDKWVGELIGGLECQVDQLYHILYHATQFDKVTRQYCETLFKHLVTILDKQQDSEANRIIEPMEVLRLLAGSVA